MTNELKECPFQKPGEHHDVRFVEIEPGYGQIGCADCGFWFPGEELLPEDKLIEAWNTRYEKTCKWELDEYRSNEEQTVWDTDCMERFVWDWKNDVVGENPVYCPGCGGKVIS